MTTLTNVKNTNLKTLISIKVDKTVKMAVDQFSDEIGIPVSTMINSFLKKIAREKTFSTDFAFTPTDETIESIKQTEIEIKNKTLKSYSISDFQKKLKKLSA